MIRRILAPLVVFAVLCSFLTVGAGPANAASGRIKAPSIGMKAPVVKVGVKNGRLLIGHSTRVVYTARHGDPACDDSGSTLYVGHTWRAGNGVADKWGKLRRGDIIRVAGCKFKVTSNKVWPDSRSIRSLSRSDGPPRIRLYGCKVDDYSKARVVTAKKLGGSNVPFPKVGEDAGVRITSIALSS
jgi:hypothetical protein